MTYICIYKQISKYHISTCYIYKYWPYISVSNYFIWTLHYHFCYDIFLLLLLLLPTATATASPTTTTTATTAATTTTTAAAAAAAATSSPSSAAATTSLHCIFFYIQVPLEAALGGTRRAVVRSCGLHDENTKTFTYSRNKALIFGCHGELIWRRGNQLRRCEPKAKRAKKDWHTDQ